MQLFQVLPRIIEVCKKHGQSYEIAIATQYDTKPFNKAMIMNIAADLMMNRCDYFIFHDVDMYLLNDDINIFRPRPTSGCLLMEYHSWCCLPTDRWPDDDGLFGGIVLLNKSDFLKMNGFSNRFWGWGGEDDNVILRMKAANIKPKRGDGIFRELGHDGSHRFEGNPNYTNNLRLRAEADIEHDGYRQIRGTYTIAKHRVVPNYEHVYAFDIVATPVDTTITLTENPTISFETYEKLFLPDNIDFMAAQLAKAGQIDDKTPLENAETTTTTTTSEDNTLNVVIITLVSLILAFLVAYTWHHYHVVGTNTQWRHHQTNK